MTPVNFRALLLAALLAGATAVRADETAIPSGPLRWPPRVKPGDTLAFIAPAGPVEQDQARRAKALFEKRGYKIKMRDDMFAVTGYLAGSDQRRSAEFMEAILDPEVDAILATRGGYGCMRMLDGVDWDQVRQHPKLVVGYSDITALHAALNRRAGIVALHGIGPASGFGGEKGPDEFSAKYFFRALEQPAAGASLGYAIDVPADFSPVISFGKGQARGRLTGGNLSMISAVEGTPYALDCRDAILLIEDVSEAPYRIDRMLRQLKLAGKLAQIRGAVLGQFTAPYERESPAEKESPDFQVDGVLRQYFQNAGIPVLANFPLGHALHNCTLPLGGEVEIDADAKTLRVIEPLTSADGR